jgi:acyl-[acyl-carrier-protein]-phospholipid O-acyltransferase/long-chain-fatty-acid--[acyl-carrier-protein] ligase
MSELNIRHTTVFEALLDAAGHYGPGRVVFQDSREPPKTYRDLVRASVGAAHLVGKLTRPGEHLGILLPNVAGTIALLFGATAAGRVPAMLNYSIGPTGIASACRTAAVRQVVTSRRFVETIRLDLADPAFAGLAFHHVEDLRAGLGIADKLYLGLWAWPRPRRAVRARDPGATAVILFTSGSEGQPKGVALSHSNIMAIVAQMDHVLPIDRAADRWFTPLPLFHSFGLIGTVLAPLLKGVYTYLHISPLAFHEIPKQLRAQRSSALFGSPTLLAHYGRSADPEDFRTLRFVVAGGEMLADEVRELYRSRFGLTIWEGYGSTESACAMALNSHRLYQPGNSVGPLLPGMEGRVVPVPGLARGGILHVRGPNVMRGYYLPERPGELVPADSGFGPGWYDTGDVVRMLDDGYLQIEGRMKRFAKVAGEMVSLELVERLARRASPHEQHAATVRLGGGGETTVLFTTDRSLTRGRLHGAARDLGVQALAVPRRIVPVDEIPVLPNGKTDYIRLREQADAAADESDPDAEQAPRA